MRTKQYMDPIALNDVVRAATVGVVEQSNSPDYAVGDHVVGASLADQERGHRALTPSGALSNRLRRHLRLLRGHS